jgi:hypothetical protein
MNFAPAPVARVGLIRLSPARGLGDQAPRLGYSPTSNEGCSWAFSPLQTRFWLPDNHERNPQRHDPGVLTAQSRANCACPSDR